jgi:hypothetical protein
MEFSKYMLIIGSAFGLSSCGGGSSGAPISPDFSVSAAFKIRVEKGAMEEFSYSFNRGGSQFENGDRVIAIKPATSSIAHNGLLFVSNSLVTFSDTVCEALNYAEEVFYTTNYVPISGNAASELARNIKAAGQVKVTSLPLPSTLKVGDKGVLFRAEFPVIVDSGFPPAGVMTSYEVKSQIGSSFNITFTSGRFGGQITGADSYEWQFLLGSSGQLELQQMSFSYGIKGGVGTYTRKSPP